MKLCAADDWHHHLRDGEALKTTVPMAARQFRRAIIMPNLKPPVTTVDQALAYKSRIMEHVPESCTFQPLMTLYLTDTTTPSEIRKAKENGIVACKLYPAGATTNSDSGVTDLDLCRRALEEMARQGILLLIHGEVTDPKVDIFHREAVFIEEKLRPLLQAHPSLKVVLEHCTTKDAVEFVSSQPAHVQIGATITAHHLLYNRNALFQGGIRPHMFCLPVLKAEKHRAALVEAATSGNPRFFIGTDSAPHETAAKESACGCAGVFTAHAALELYAEAFFDLAGASEDTFEAFINRFGPDFYGLPRNTDTIELRREPWMPPKSYEYLGGGGTLVPLRANQTIEWSLSS